MLETEIKSILERAKQLYGVRGPCQKFNNKLKVLDRELKLRTKYYGNRNLLPVFERVRLFIRQMRAADVPGIESLPKKYDVILSNAAIAEHKNSLFPEDLFLKKGGRDKPKRRLRAKGNRRRDWRRLPGGYGTGRRR